MSPESKADLEKHYARKMDPWDYQSCPADAYRKSVILEVLKNFQPRPFFNALDVGCGEGWITKDLPAEVKWGYDLSDTAMARLPPEVEPFNPKAPGRPSFDLVVCTGVLYESYDWQMLLTMIKAYASGIVLTCHIQDREVPQVPYIGAQIYATWFAYPRPEQNYKQVLRVFKV